MIDIIDLSKSYGAKRVLKNIHLTMSKSSVHGIVGKNGAGKTTLFRCLAGLETYDGEIDSNFDILKNHLGFLQTQPYFFSKITGREYLQFLCNARDLKRVDFDEKNVFDLPLNHYASTYSTGMKKKLALMGVLLQQNDILILDEPFNGVDIQSNMLISGIIHKLKAVGKIVMISSHIFSTLSDTCDEIHLLKDGVFVKKAEKSDFNALDAQMKADVLENRIERLGLT
jgi:ABC-2 type transport system ATP-binding protein